MKGLLLKDCYIAKSNIIITFISLIVIGFGISFLMESSSLLILSPAIFTTAVFISITADASSKWNKLVVTMPVSRQQIIAGKYIMYAILAIAGIVTGIIPCVVLHFIRHDVTGYSVVLYSLLGLGVSFFAGSISLLCAYMFDPENSQVVFMISFVGAAGIIAGIVLFVNIFIPVKENILLAFTIAFIVSIISLVCSCKVAANIYVKKDI